MSFDGPTMPPDDPFDWKGAWSAHDKEIRDLAANPHNRNLRLGLGMIICLGFFGMLLWCDFLAVRTAMNDARYWLFVVLLIPICVVSGRLALIFSWHGILFFLGCENRISQEIRKQTRGG
jgi:hypothetical protein